MDNTEIMKILCHGQRPCYSNDYAAGLDLRFNEETEVIIEPLKIKKLKTGVSVEIPKGHFGLVAMRSGLGFRGLSLTNGVGIIDEDYRGEIGISVVNFSEDPICLAPGERVAQLIIIPYIHPQVQFVDELSETQRGDKGFGSSGRF